MDTLYQSEIAGLEHTVDKELALHRSILNSVTSGVCIVDATIRDMPITYVNPAFEAITGYSLAEMIGKNCRILQGTQRQQPELAAIRAAIAARQNIVSVLRNFRKDGTPFWNELSLSPIRNTEGRVTHFIGIQSDVTVRIELEKALLQSEKLAAVGRLAASIAHEINNPLESVMNLVYLAQHADNSTDTRQYLATADMELRRVKLITSQSLRFYKQSTVAQTIGCSQLLRSLLGLYTSRLKNTGVTLQCRERATLDITCLESEVRQVLHNLVSNAIDSMHSSSGLLFVRTRNATHPRTGVPGVLFTIADTGCGIKPEDLPCIFNAFFTTKGDHSTGLGLWVSSEIVARHHGQLLVRSRTAPGRSGTVFQLFLPLQMAS
jgi:PAS domain S-box-containing protein